MIASFADAISCVIHIRVNYLRWKKSVSILIVMLSGSPWLAARCI